MTSFELDLPTEEATEQLAQRLGALLRAGDLLVLTGDLGAGKTFFAGELCRALGLDADEPVTSPTFALVNEYETIPPICHADLYRLGSDEEIDELGLEERRAQGWLLVVEWGSPFVAALGGDAIELSIDLEPRHATIEGKTTRSREIAAALCEKPGT